MGKKNQIQDSPEYKYFEENFDALMSEMEQDKESECFEIPDEWDREFRKVIKETLEKNKREREKRRKGLLKVVGIVTAAMVVLLVGNFTVEQVNGEGLLIIFKNVLHMDGNHHVIYGNGNEIEISLENEEEDILFSGNDLSEINEQIRQEIKKPMLYLNYVPEGFYVVDARYNHPFRVLNIELSNETDHIYVFQQQQIEETAVGIQSKENICGFIFNDNLKQEISIYDNMQDNYLTISVNYGDSVISIHATISIEECKKLAESIEYK